MSHTYYEIERSFCEYLESNVSTGTGEVFAFEFPLSKLGSHTYAIEFISDRPIPVAGRAIDGGSRGRYIESLANVNVFRMPAAGGDPDIEGAKRMIANVADLFRGTHYIPLKTYGATPTPTTTGTTVGAIKVDEEEKSKQAFDPNPNVRRYSADFRLLTKEVF